MSDLPHTLYLVSACAYLGAVIGNLAGGLGSTRWRGHVAAIRPASGVGGWMALLATPAD